MTHTSPRHIVRDNPLGFTIIEVLIVLSLASLILLIVFVAVPSAERNKRNYVRKHDVDTIAAELEQYRTLHNNTYPFTAATAPGFIGDMAHEVTSTVQFHEESGDHDYVPPFDTITFQPGHWCNRYGDGDSPSDPIAGTDIYLTKYVIWTQLETAAGGPIFYCIDNHS